MYTLKELIAKAYDELLVSGLAEKTVYGANWYIWNRLVRVHGEDAIFHEEMCYEYCISYFKRDIYKVDRTDLLEIESRYITAFNNLIQSSKDIPFKKSNLHYRRDFILDERSERLLDEYLEVSKNNGNNERTILNKKLRIRNFMIDIDFPNINGDKVVDYLKRRKESKTLTSYTIEIRLIRAFLDFCYEKGELSRDILLLWPKNFPNVKDKNIPSVYSIEEIRIILESAKNSKHFDNHLRNYAILSLITYTGMRANDVANLKPGNIDWRNNEICFVQQKTKREVTYPLLPQIGNPIIEYIKEERPNGEYLFLKENGNKLVASHITGIINSCFRHAPVRIDGRHFGAHALRHSIATNMVNEGISLFSVANVLGHSSIACVKIYGKVDLEGLRKCVLEAPYNA